MTATPEQIDDVLQAESRALQAARAGAGQPHPDRGAAGRRRGDQGRRRARKAEGVLKQVKAGKDFAALAKENSQDPGQRRQGRRPRLLPPRPDGGPVQRGGLQAGARRGERSGRDAVRLPHHQGGGEAGGAHGAARRGAAAARRSSSRTRTASARRRPSSPACAPRARSRSSSDRPPMRVDAWLDVACLFKTRSEAKRGCESGKVEVNGDHAKPHRVAARRRSRPHQPRLRPVSGRDRPHPDRSARQEGRGARALRRRDAQADAGGDRDAARRARLPRRRSRPPAHPTAAAGARSAAPRKAAEPVPRNQEVIRQWKVLHALETARHGVAIDALADELGVTTRTIRRDLAALQEAGFPLYDEKDDDGRVRWRLEGQVLKGLETGFTLAELCALYLSRNLLESVAGTPFRRDLTHGVRAHREDAVAADAAVPRRRCRRCWRPSPARGRRRRRRAGRRDGAAARRHAAPPRRHACATTRCRAAARRTT